KPKMTFKKLVKEMVAADIELMRKEILIDGGGEVNEKHFRPTEVDLLINNPKKVEENLKWKPKMTFKKLVKEMVAADIELMRK
ncbi:unnamed protein product, partial [Rotaria sordida]